MMMTFMMLVEYAMTEDDVFEKTEGAYLCLIHPNRHDQAHRQAITTIVALAPSVPDEVVAAMITGASWRERLLGLCMAMAKRPAIFIEPILQSLRDPRGISIVPACAVLAVLARRGVFVMNETFSEMFDRTVFGGDIGWAVDKAMYVTGLRSNDVPERGSNYGQIFDDHFEIYDSIYAAIPI